MHVTWLVSFVIMQVINPQLAFFWFVLFLIVLLHEYGHIIAGRSLGYKAYDVTLYPFGGAASMDIPERPWHEFLVAISGPMVNVVLIPLFAWAAVHYPVFVLFLTANIGLLVFNLLPIFPMDGGRVLRSFLQMVSGNRKASTLIAARIGQAICLFFMLFGLLNGQFMLALVGLMMFSAAQSELAFVCSKNSKVDVLATILFCEKCKEQAICIEGCNSMIDVMQNYLKDLDRYIKTEAGN